MTYSNNTDRAKIPVFRPPVPSGMADSVLECIESRWWGYGPRCHILEQKFTESRGGWALATNSCTSALHLVGRILRKSKYDEIIIPAMTFVSTAMAFEEAGMKVIPVDVLPESLLIDPSEVERHITPQTRAVVAVHLYGQKPNIEALRDICNRHGLALVEDCAPCIGSLRESPAGDFACYSFNAVKEAPAGEGGLLWGKHHELEDSIREISYLGMTVDTWQRSLPFVHRPYASGVQSGLKLRMTDIAATFVLSCLPQLDEWHNRRTNIFAYYDQHLPVLASVIKTFPRHPADSHLMYVIRVHNNDREHLRNVLAVAGIASSVHYPSLSRHQLWAGVGNCPIAEEADTELLTLPCFPDLTQDSQRLIVNKWRQSC